MVQTEHYGRCASTKGWYVFNRGHGFTQRPYSRKLLPQYTQTFQVIKKIGDKTVDIIDQQGKTRRATFPQLRKVTPMEALLTKIPANMRYGRQAKYLKSSLPEVLRDIFLMQSLRE